MIGRNLEGFRWTIFFFRKFYDILIKNIAYTILESVKNWIYYFFAHVLIRRKIERKQRMFTEMTWLERRRIEPTSTLLRNIMSATPHRRQRFPLKYVLICMYISVLNNYKWLAESTETESTNQPWTKEAEFANVKREK